MSDASSPTPSEPTPQAPKTRVQSKCLIFPLPKVVFFYPTALAAFLAAIFSGDVRSYVVPKAVAFGYLNARHIDDSIEKQSNPYKEAEISAENKSEVLASTEEENPVAGISARRVPEFKNENRKAWAAIAEEVGALNRDHGAHPSYWWGWIFLIVFTMNVMVISFDFPGVKAMAVAFLGMAVVFGGAYLNVQHEFLPSLGRWLNQITPYATSHFYFYIGVVLMLIILMSVLINRFWNKWIIESNRLVHKHGMLGDVKEWPTLNLQIRKEINDIFEWCLLLSGSLVFLTGSGERPIVLENIPWINRKEKQIRKILEAWRTD